MEMIESPRRARSIEELKKDFDELQKQRRLLFVSSMNKNVYGNDMRVDYTQKPPVLSWIG